MVNEGGSGAAVWAKKETLECDCETEKREREE